MNHQIDIESRIRERLDEIKSVPPRNPQAAARGRARFLTQAVTAREAQHRKGWGSIFTIRQFAMNMAVTVLVIASLLMGGGMTVKAAQDDLPGEPLYAVKTFSEDVSLQFQNNPETRVDRLMQLTQTRVEEMTRMVETGQTPPEHVQQRLEQHLQQALQLCSNMDDTELDQKLPKIHAQLQQEERNVQRLQDRAAQGAQSVLGHTRAMLQAQLKLVDDGLRNHEAFRKTVQNGLRYGQTQTPTAMPLTSPTPGYLQNDQAGATPGNSGNGNNNGNGNGVGPTTNPGKSHPHMTATPKPTNTGPGNNAGGNDNKKDKTKDPKDNRPPTRTPK